MIAFIYIALQRWRGDVWMSGDLPDRGWKWKWSLILLNVGMLGMTIALLIAGYEQSFIERAIGGSTWAAYFEGQTQPWFVQGMQWRMIFGVLMTAGARALALGFPDHRTRRDTAGEGSPYACARLRCDSRARQ